MRRTMMHGKIHRCRVTDADLEYEGSVTIDQTLMEAAGIVPYEAVRIWNVTQGTRLETYALPGPADSGVICANGAAAHLNDPDDIVIIAAFCDLDDEEIDGFEGTCVRVDEETNEIIEIKTETPGPKMPPRIDKTGS